MITLRNRAAVAALLLMAGLLVATLVGRPRATATELQSLSARFSAGLEVGMRQARQELRRP